MKTDKILNVLYIAKRELSEFYIPSQSQALREVVDLIDELKKEDKRPTHYLVAVTKEQAKQYRKDEVKSGYLAWQGKIALYSRGVAIKKAKSWGGKAKLFKGKFDKDLYVTF